MIILIKKKTLYIYIYFIIHSSNICDFNYVAILRIFIFNLWKYQEFREIFLLYYLSKNLRTDLIIEYTTTYISDHIFLIITT